MPSIVSAAYPCSSSSAIAAARIACRVSSLRRLPMPRTLQDAASWYIPTRYVSIKEQDMRVIVMGGTSGIGLATAELLTAAGAEVIVTGRDPEKLAAVKDRVAVAEQGDGTHEEQVAAFLERTGPVDHLVLAFSGGAGAFGPVREVGAAAVLEAFTGKV